MISVAALRMQQFGVQFYQACLTAKDIDKLVRFEVLSYGEQSASGVRGNANQSKVRWDLLERRIASSEKAYQRQIIRKKIDELVQYYEQCRQARDLPSIPGAVIISCDEKLTFEPVESGSSVGRLKVPEREGILRAIDGQHRLLALHADIDNIGDDFTVPAIIFDRLPEDHVVQMFVTINAKHTRLNASHLVSLSGRQLYRDDALAAAHDVVRALSERDDSALKASPLERLLERVKSVAPSTRGLRIQGVDGLMVRYAACCQPVPGDRVVGYVTRGRGVSVHRADCPNLLQLAHEPERRLEIVWQRMEGERFLIRLAIEASDRRGLYADLATAVGEAGTDIRSLELKSTDGRVNGEKAISAARSSPRTATPTSPRWACPR